jgi:hypothetical protein
LPREFFGDGMDADVRAAVDAALVEYRKLGAVTVEVSLPNSGLSVPAYYVIAPAEASSNLSRFDGVRYGYRAPEYADLAEMYSRSRAQGFGAEVKRRILIGTYVLSHGYYDAYYLKAQKIRRLIAADFAEAFKACDVIMGPTSPSVAFAFGAKSADPVQMYLSDIYTISTNLAGLPGMSLPCGFGTTTCRSACRSSATGSARRRCSTSRTSTRRPPTGTGACRRPAMNWEVVIGLETHAQLQTKSKIFSGSSIAFGAEPNMQANAVDIALPGVLPVLNREAVVCAIKFGLAVGATIAPRSVFARKNYFYPDLPKGYQISQFEIPVVQGGGLTIRVGSR